ncbi:conserved hypothetical protein [Vibrio nigripulchritudo MADA3029]|uniref:SMI1/KNR4 family protein n=1 Tax=Vibrio nigripulchritudo TaxID=28173 RepID=UPI0003B1BDC1|nr:SMI1/KNR4 family protein [Vibrio nigripulchritudo]CCN49845.1 conserved hypothetical protein [Vibrio nigripulchritudo MADA3020]CCN55287.1 conserved hypothetical protein [Vibrio nigripulchritudo MADA3021]CCN58005.1 conserved hypothetical protein [Vibrio nigripulchritudo MADA3029]
MSTFDEIIQLMENSGEEIESSSPASEDIILEVEQTLGVEFPVCYKQFLAKFGYLSFDGEEFYGITPSGTKATNLPSVYFATLSSRKRGDISNEMIKIQSSGYGPNICIDVSKDCKGAVYEVPLSFKRDKEKNKLSNSFSEYLHSEINRIIDEL